MDFSISQSTANVDFGGSQASFKDIDFNTEVSASVNAAHKLFKITGSVSGLTRPDKLAVRSWDITENNTGDAIVLPQFSKIEGDTITLIVSSSAAAKATGSFTLLIMYNNQMLVTEVTLKIESVMLQLIS